MLRLQTQNGPKYYFGDSAIFVGDLVYHCIMRFSHLEPKNTRHFIEQVKVKQLDPRAIIETWRNPEEVYPSGSHPGQWRVTGNGVCIVGKPDEDTGQFVFITIYEDRVLTAPRIDQIDAAGQRYRDRWQAGLGRG